MKKKGIPVAAVTPGSIAHQSGVETGDIITGINGQPVRDILDYRFLAADEFIVVDIEKPDGERWELEIEKDFYEDIGLDFGAGELSGTRSCSNRCIFCFVEQMPPAMRESLYVKDDDYRLSFLQGNFITLTNLGEKDINRIISQRLSPLYVSVHTTDPPLRQEIMGNPRAGKVLEIIKRLVEAGIEIHAQAVLCPGINDGGELNKTVADLTALWPGVRSLALVPVGLTAFREGLYPLNTYTPERAGNIIHRVEGWQRACLEVNGYPTVFASDEFYLLAGEPIPGVDYYADFPQTENGVGLTRLFLDQWNELKPFLPSKLKNPLDINLVTGKLAETVLRPLVGELNVIENLNIRLTCVENSFFGKTVTVAGLLTAGDVIVELKREWEANYGNKGLPQLVVIPSVMLRADEELFIDDFTLSRMEEELGVPVRAVEGPEQLFNILKAHC